MTGRQPLPQLAGDQMFVTDGGLETDLMFHHGLELPCFAAFPLVADPDSREVLRRYYAGYLDVARRHGTGFVVEAPTWRANPDWAAQLGISVDRLDALNRQAIELAEEVRATAAADGITAVVSGCVGPRERTMTAAEAQDYHAPQIASFAATTADLVTAVTINDAAEAVGIVRAATAVDVPVAVSFTVETDGRLATGQSLREAVEQVDADTADAAAYFMVNCAHPSHLTSTFEDGPWLRRVVGLRLNASARSHAELDDAEDLDEGDPDDFGAGTAALRERLPAATVFGGCCGTDARHVAAIWRRLVPH
ncbi:homocysteine S-methyltransferase family protein [Mycolicibacterium sp. P1-18]|uniref:homocysteine S-methyltransferase family protein n=1 Tax=Mycolicibacterium sp. P1-18 TaxID=2024615 RepID=UPI001F5BF9B7|nr:homocysteine S-methyltransferase family protein [Mycolicibacterium sp. P1-18]